VQQQHVNQCRHVSHVEVAQQALLLMNAHSKSHPPILLPIFFHAAQSMPLQQLKTTLFVFQPDSLELQFENKNTIASHNVPVLKLSKLPCFFHTERSETQSEMSAKEVI